MPDEIPFGAFAPQPAVSSGLDSQGFAKQLSPELIALLTGGDPFSVAAARQRNAVKPAMGRQDEITQMLARLFASNRVP